MGEPIILGRDEGEAVSPRLTVKADRGELVVTEMLYQPGQRGPEPHFHKLHCDVFYVAEGEIVVEIDGTPSRVETHGFALVPPNTVHTFRNEGDVPARILNIHAPGTRFAEYVRRMAAGDDFDPAEYDSYFA
jgi:mannose-6-phosphate isomerase-like protein (cupin superfamily)